jgi:ABC-2 type transport system permease protein
MRNRILQHEWKMLRGDVTLWIALALLIALTAYAAYNGAQWRRLIATAPQSAQTAEQKEYAALRQELADITSGKIVIKPDAEFGSPDYHRDVRDPYITGYYGKVVTAAPPPPLLGLCIGQSDLNPSYYLINTRPRHELMTFAKTAEIENPLHLLIGNFDLSFVVVYLFPLLIIALSYNLISGEREAGTLALALSMPVSLRQLVMGKLALRVGLITALALLLSLAAFWLSESPVTAWPRLALWCALTLLYGLFWFALSLLIAARNTNSANNAVALTACWLGLVVIVPALVTLLANVIYPIPSRATMVQALRAAEREVAEAQHQEQVVNEFAAAYTGKFTGDIRAVIKQRADVMTDYTRREAVNLRLAGLERRFDEAKARQQSFTRKAALLSPALLMQLLLSDVAGTNGERFERFAAEVAAFHQQWRDYFTVKLLHGAQLSLADLNGLPRFLWQDETINNLSRRLFAGIAALIVFTASLSWLAVRQLTRSSLF